jgi:hypothetical protein
MKKYLDLLPLIPIALCTMIFVAEKEIHDHTKQACVGFISYLFIFSIMYLLILKFNCKKWFLLLIALSMWILLVLLRKKYLLI